MYMGKLDFFFSFPVIQSVHCMMTMVDYWKVNSSVMSTFYSERYFIMSLNNKMILS